MDENESTAEKPKRLSNATLQKNVTALAGQVDDVTDAVNDLAEQAEERDKSVNDKLDQMMLVFSRNFNKAVEPMEMDQGTERAPMTMGLDEVGDSVAIDKGLYDVDAPETQKKLDELAFNEEPVTVLIQSTSEKNADQVFDVQVNNKSQIFMRGGTYTVRRKFVEGLARAKPVHYDNETYTEIRNGTEFQAVRYPGRRGLRYAFTVLEDKNPRGAAWLAGILAQP